MLFIDYSTDTSGTPHNYAGMSSDEYDCLLSGLDRRMDLAVDRKSYLEGQLAEKIEQKRASAVAHVRQMLKTVEAEIKTCRVKLHKTRVKIEKYHKTV